MRSFRIKRRAFRLVPPYGGLLVNRNTEAFSLNAIVDVRLRRRHEMVFLISRKLLELATSKFTT